jgi:variant SH3 domain-containing protein
VVLGRAERTGGLSSVQLRGMYASPTWLSSPIHESQENIPLNGNDDNFDPSALVDDRVGIFPSCFVAEVSELHFLSCSPLEAQTPNQEVDKVMETMRPLKRPPWYPYYVIALYPTTVEEFSFELELEAGTLIKVEYICSDGWWKGRTNDGRSGWFQDNYVRPVLDRRESFIPYLDSNGGIDPVHITREEYIHH